MGLWTGTVRQFNLLKKTQRICLAIRTTIKLLPPGRNVVALVNMAPLGSKKGCLYYMGLLGAICENMAEKSK